MNVQELIARVQGLCGELALHGERIRYRLPHTPDAPRLVEELRAHREEIIAALESATRASGPLVVPRIVRAPMRLAIGGFTRRSAWEGYREWLLKWEAKGRVQ